MQLSNDELKTVKHSELITRLRSIQDDLMLCNIAPEIKKQIYKDLNDIIMKLFVDAENSHS